MTIPFNYSINDTIFIQNGSIWYGDWGGDDINKGLLWLKEYTLEERLFRQYTAGYSNNAAIIKNLNPITPITDQGGYTMQFLCHFEETAKGFHIKTSNSHLIASLKDAIKSNKGWKLYYETNLYRQLITQLSLF